MSSYEMNPSPSKSNLKLLILSSIQFKGHFHFGFYITNEYA